MSSRPLSSRVRMAASSASSSQPVIKVMISTDNHLGYLEKDPIRGDDSFRAFEEVLELAKSNEVDMLLLAGDLFHDNKPSRSTMLKTMSLLRKACLSPGGAIRLAVRSDPTQINYMNPTVAVSLPVFVIHGNHDDPTGAPSLSAIDLLAEAGLVTYFGKMSNARRLDIMPILLQKGRTALALYGIGNIRDEILHQTWAKERNVRWLRPKGNSSDRDVQRRLPDTDTGGDDDLRWFNVLVLHQNRVTRGMSKGIPETLLPRWLDYVVWGHEHDSIPDLTCTSPPVVQPGSTVATSLSDGESKPKHAILLEIRCGKLKHRPIPLYTVRKFKFRDIALSNHTDVVSDTDPASIVSFLENTVKELAEEQEAEFDEVVTAFRTNNFQAISGVCYPPNKFYVDKLNPLVRQPLVRLRVEISGNWEVPSPQRFGQSFVGRIACPFAILLVYRSRRGPLKKSRTFMDGHIEHDRGQEMEEDEDGFLLSQDGTQQGNTVQIPRLIQYFLYHNKAGGTGLKFLELDKLSAAVNDFVVKEEPKAITDYVSSYLKLQQDQTFEEVEKNENLLDETKLLEKFKAGATEAAQRVFQEMVDKRTSSASNEKGNKIKIEEKSEDILLDTEQGEGHESGIQNAGTRRSDPVGLESIDGGADNANASEHFLDDVHAVLNANPKLAAAIQKIEPTVDSDSVNGEDGTGSAPTRTPATKSRRRGGSTNRGRGRGRGSGRGSGRGRGSNSSSVKVEDEIVLQRTPARSTGLPRASTRHSARNRIESIMEDSDDEKVEEDAIMKVSDEEEEIIKVSDEEEEFKPMSTSRKRRASGSASSSRTPQRARAESIAGSGRSAFANGARIRRNTATIDVHEESGDDAM